MPDPYQIKLSQLRILIAVAHHGNFSEAALSLEMSQSAVSHAIATLEDHLGVTLFNRGRHGASLAAVGEKILNHAQEISHSLDLITHEAMEIRGLEGGQIRIATFRSIATRILPSIMAAFHQRHPQIKVSMTEYDDYRKVEQALRDSQTDVGFTMLPSSADMSTQDFLQDEFVVINRAIHWHESQGYGVDANGGQSQFDGRAKRDRTSAHSPKIEPKPQPVPVVPLSDSVNPRSSS
ncbi:MAG: LysR family transcriptional regulator [Thermosynechococcaceae cyanobacterium]